MDLLTAFQKVLDPADNSTGGGTAAGIAGAMAAALVAMVARLSVGKGLGEPDEFYREIAAAGEDLAHRLAEGSAQDAEAFGIVAAAYKMPKDTPEQKAARSQAIQEGLGLSTRLPLQNAELCVQTAALCRRLGGRANRNALSDLQVATYLADAGLRGSLDNVEINLPGLKDEALVQTFRARVAELRSTEEDGNTHAA